jgi:hypothetical protein
LGGIFDPVDPTIDRISNEISPLEVAHDGATPWSIIDAVEMRMVAMMMTMAMTTTTVRRRIQWGGDRNNPILRTRSMRQASI